MALTVEDGTGLAAADAFVSLTDCDAYHTDRGNSTWTGTNADKEAAIRRATAYVSGAFRFKGVPVRGRLQALSWPRYYAYDEDGELVLSGAVPAEVVDATCEAALRELVSAGSLFPVVNTTERVKRKKVDVLEVEYFGAPISASASRPVVTAIRDLLRGLLSSSGLSGQVSREWHRSGRGYL